VYNPDGICSVLYIAFLFYLFIHPDSFTEYCKMKMNSRIYYKIYYIFSIFTIHTDA